MVKEFLVRVGTFLILIGIGMLILFIASANANQANFDYLFWAVLAVSIGFMLQRRRQPPRPSGRFESLRKWTGRSRGGRKDEDRE